jgi:tRNA (guanine-N7-)-methyltransferase
VIERSFPTTGEAAVADDITGSPSAAHLAHAADRNRRVATLRVLLTATMSEVPPTEEWALELGCGHGHFLTAFAEEHPTVHCWGVDFCRDRIQRAERKLQRSGLRNLRFIRAEAGEFLDAWPKDAKFRHVFVLFPDPWPKRRHRKHRLVSQALLDRLAAVAAIGCAFFFRSDALDYVAEIRAVVSVHSRWRLRPEADLPVATGTVFQAKASRFESLAAVLVS